MKKLGSKKSIWLSSVIGLSTILIAPTVVSCSLLIKDHDQNQNDKPNEPSIPQKPGGDNNQQPGGGEPSKPGGGNNQQPGGGEPSKPGGDNNQNPGEGEPQNPGDGKPPITPPQPPKPPQPDPLPPPGSGNNSASNPYGHSVPNPDYPRDPHNSFLISPNGQQKGDDLYMPSPGIKQNQTLESWKLTNNQQVINAKKTFAFTIGTTNHGTAWLLDYQIPEGIDETKPGFQYDDTNYPTTWYIATNAHVLDDFVDAVPGTPGILYPCDPYYQGSTVAIPRSTSVNMQYIDNPAIGSVSSIFKGVSLRTKDTSYEGETYKIFEDNCTMRRVYFGNDFLTTSPKDFNTHIKFLRGQQEYADFAVLEVNFVPYVYRKMLKKSGSIIKEVHATAQQYAKYATQDYANLPKNQKFVYKTDTDLLHDQTPIQGGGLNIVGFPQNRVTKQLEVFINRPSGDTSTKASNLSTAKAYTTFTKKDDGVDNIMDGIIGMGGWFGYEYKSTLTSYSTWGLIYPIDYGSLGPGSSGSLVTDQNGISWGIHFAADEKAVTGSAQAFYSQGYDYKGKYGKYNLPAYDLIAGEPESTKFPYQQTSYRSNLVKIYGSNSNIRTNIFPKGINHADYK